MAQLRPEIQPSTGSSAGEHEAREAARRELLANLSHEVRTPIASILGLAELLIEDGDLGHVATTRAAAVARMKESGARLLRFVDRLLELSELSALDDRETTRFNPFALAEELRTTVGPLAKKRMLALRVECAIDLPEGIESDRASLHAVLRHLLENAIRFTPRGEVSLNVRLCPSVGLPHLIFEIRDTGVGMSADRLDALFEPLVGHDRSDPRSYGGTGLGLAIVDELVQQLGGSIEVESELDAGACFRVRIPVGPPAPPVAAA